MSMLEPPTKLNYFTWDVPFLCQRYNNSIAKKIWHYNSKISSSFKFTVQSQLMISSNSNEPKYLNFCLSLIPLAGLAV
mgnify:CR=1 FL=1